MQDNAEVTESTQDESTAEVQIPGSPVQTENVEQSYVPLPDDKERVRIPITEDLVKVFFEASTKVNKALVDFQTAEKAFKEANTHFTDLVTVKLEGTGISMGEVLGVDLDTKEFQLIIIKK
jgi:hypothetical protein